MRFNGDAVTHETLFKGFGRLRDVVVGPDGLVYVALNEPGADSATWSRRVGRAGSTKLPRISH